MALTADWYRKAGYLPAVGGVVATSYQSGPPRPGGESEEVVPLAVHHGGPDTFDTTSR